MPKDKKRPVNAYIQGIIARRSGDKGIKSHEWLLEDQLPRETELRFISIWDLPETYRGKISESYFQDIYPKNKTEFLDIHHELEKFFKDLYEKDCVNIFAQEMSFIIGLYRIMQKNLRPTKAELKKATSRTIKVMKKHLSSLDKYLGRIQGKPEWLYIEDLIFKASKEVQEKQEPDGTPSIILAIGGLHFFKTIHWMNLACQQIGAIPETLFNDYDAHGREVENRNKALLALASSYDFCFNDKNRGIFGKDFDFCARLFLQCIGVDIGREDGTDKLRDERVDTLIKETTKNYRMLKDNDIQKWLSLN